MWQEPEVEGYGETKKLTFNQRWKPLRIPEVRVTEEAGS